MQDFIILTTTRLFQASFLEKYGLSQKDYQYTKAYIL